MIRNGSLLYKFLFFIYLIALLCLMLLTIKTDQMEIPKQFLGIEIDKVVHFIIFFPYSILAWLAFNVSCTKRFKNWTFLVIVFSGLLLAASTELTQSFNPNRNYDPNDMLANFIAVFAGTFVITVINYVWVGRLQ